MTEGESPTPMYIGVTVGGIYRGAMEIPFTEEFERCWITGLWDYTNDHIAKYYPETTNLMQGQDLCEECCRYDLDWAPVTPSLADDIGIYADEELARDLTSALEQLQEYRESEEYNNPY